MSDEKIPAAETSRYVQRGETLAQGSRTGQDRRDDKRGLSPGRRYVEQSRVRREFIERIKEMQVQGFSNQSIAHILNDEGLVTARSERWTESAIEQLLNTERAREGREAWRPQSLERGDGEGS